MFSSKSRRTSSSLKMVLSNTVNNNRDMTTGGNVSLNSNNKTIAVFNKNASSYRNGIGGMTWGSPTWTFLHTFAEKIKDEHFDKLRNEVLKNIFTICTNLPCPDCSLHSKNYLNSQNFNTIKNRSQLKTMLYEFHNSVNLRKGNDLFNRADLDEKYSNRMLKSDFYNFIIKFKDRGANNRFIHEDVYRSQIAKDLIKWFNANKEFFD
jgi:hypothetical protein